MTPVVLAFLEQARRTPDAVAASDDTGATETYASLARRGCALAAGLQARLGTDTGRIVAIAHFPCLIARRSATS